MSRARGCAQEYEEKAAFALAQNVLERHRPMRMLQSLRLALRGVVLLVVTGASIVLAGCDGATPTSLRVSLITPSDLALGALDVRFGSRERRLDARRDFSVLVDDSLAGMPTPLVVRGLVGDSVIASGRAVVTPVLHRETPIVVTLSPVACGAWCARGATECRGGAIVTCEQRDDDPCMEWSDAIVCPATSPSCSFGVCAPTCVDECVADETQCAGPEATRACGQADADPCLDLLTPVACEAGRTCSSGTCVATCRDDCVDGAARCVGQGVAHCRDLNADGCFEWGPPEPCSADEVCDEARCQIAVSCHDECDADTCEGDTHRVCGNFDLDSCRELSAGTRCAPVEGTCDLAACAPTGCTRVPRACGVDGGVGERDAGVDVRDAGVDVRDAGNPARDSGVEPGDSGALRVDARVDAPADSGPGSADAGIVVAPDSGVVAPTLPADGVVFVGSSCTARDLGGDRVERCRTAIATSPGGVPAIAVYAPSARSVLALAPSATGWSADTVGGALSSTNVGIAIERSGVLDIVFQDRDEVRLARRAPGTSFELRNVGTVPRWGEDAFAIALDPVLDVPVVAACRDALFDNVDWGQPSGSTGWLYRGTEHVAGYCVGLGLTVDAAGRAVVLATGTGVYGGGAVELFGDTVRSSLSAALANARIGTWPTGSFVVYATGDTSRELRFTGIDGTPDERIDRTSSADAFRDLAVATDAFGVPHVVFLSGTQLWHARRGASARWEVAMVATPASPDVGSLSAAADPFGRLLVAYADVDGVFRFATVR